MLTSSKHVQMHAGKPKWCLVHNSACKLSGVHTNMFTFTHTHYVSHVHDMNMFLLALTDPAWTLISGHSLCV